MTRMPKNKRPEKLLTAVVGVLNSSVELHNLFLSVGTALGDFTEGKQVVDAKVRKAKLIRQLKRIVADGQKRLTLIEAALDEFEETVNSGNFTM
jgi:hypothetical protein